ncbi:MAG: preprotein translocase subunit SecG [Phycisphaerae bacterium]
MEFWDVFLGVLFLVICFLLIVIVLLQKGKGGGLGAAFGGMGSSAFGTKTGDVFTWVTIVLTGLFLLLAVTTSLVFRPAPGTIAAPEFQPPPGPLTEPTSVTIDCRTQGAVIYYTLDGEDPDKDSAPYDKPVRIEPPMTLKARAFRGKWPPSAVATAEYTLADANQVPTSRIDAPALKPGTEPAPEPGTKPASRPATAPAANRTPGD